MSADNTQQQALIPSDHIEGDVNNVSDKAQVAVGKDIIQAGRDVYSAETIYIIYTNAGVNPATVREERALASNVCAHLLQKFLDRLDSAGLPLETRVYVVDEGLQLVYYQIDRLKSVEIPSAELKPLRDQIQQDLEAYRQSKLKSDIDPQNAFAQSTLQTRAALLRQYIEQSRAFLQKALTLFRQDAEAHGEAHAPQSPPPEQSRPKQPYKFLDFFEEKDAAIFFGRERETKDLLANIFAYRLNVLYAKSGAGKTSLLYAGILPRLHQEGYLVVFARILEDPLTDVQQAINDQLPQPIAVTPETALHDFLQQVVARDHRPLVLILDQFEEFFIHFEKAPAVRAAFIKQLGRVYTANLPVTLVIALRKDFFGALAEAEDYLPTIFNRGIRLEPLTADQAREAIAKPVELYGVAYEEGLLEQILHDLAPHAEAVEPPQLQIVCNALWQKLVPGEAVITRQIYDAAGGSRKILAEYLKEIVAEFALSQRQVVWAILKAMVTSQQTKKPLELREFQDNFATSGAPEFSPDNIAQVLQRLINRRLVRSVERRDALYYELAHEYLIDQIHAEFKDEEKELKQAEEILERALANYADQAHRTLMPRKQVRFVEKYRTQLALNDTAQELLRQSKQRSRQMIGLTIAAIVGLAALIAVAAYQEYLKRREDFRLRYNIGLIPAIINPAQAELQLYRINKDQDGDPIPVNDFTGQALYVQAGDYMLEARKDGWTLQYPIYLEGYGTVAKEVRVTFPQKYKRPENLPDDMAYIPAGWFRMGDKENEGYPNEKPAHDVYLDAFLMDKKEVTNGEYQEFIKDHGHQQKEYWTEDGWNWDTIIRDRRPEFWEIEKYVPPEKPVERMNWYAADAYCRWKEKQLPTEAEWEKAARGPEGYRYAYGNVFDATKIDLQQPMANDYELYNMSGGVWEWVADWYDEDYYGSYKLTAQSFEHLGIDGIPEKILEDLKPLNNREFSEKNAFLEALEERLSKKQLVQYQESILRHAQSSPDSNPKGPKEPLKGNYRVLRGGSSATTGKTYGRVAFRWYFGPDEYYYGQKIGTGFRCVRPAQ